MGSLVATGGLFVEADIVACLEKSIAFICGRFGVPSKEECKWSPRSTSWMRTNLVLGARKEFFLHVVQTCKDHEATASVVISDEISRTPHSSTTRQSLTKLHHWLLSDTHVVRSVGGWPLPITYRKILYRCKHARSRLEPFGINPRFDFRLN